MSAVPAPFNTRARLVKGFITYMGYFGAKYVGNDIQVLCGNIFDHAAVKTFTLFCIMYQATDRLHLSLILTTFFMTFQYVLSLTTTCSKYVDKTGARNIDRTNVIWPRNRDVTSLGVPKVIEKEKEKEREKPTVDARTRLRARNNVPQSTYVPYL